MIHSFVAVMASLWVAVLDSFGVGLLHGHLWHRPFSVRFLLHKSGALNNSASGSSSYRKAPHVTSVPGQAATWEQVLSQAGR